MIASSKSKSTPQLVNSQAEQRVTLNHVTWSAYEQILAALGEHRAARLTYDRGLLEIMVPLEPHENPNRLIELFIRILIVELDLNIKTMGSTTLKYPELETSPEPDSAYYIQNESLVRGREIDLTQDPPPDLVLEVDITHTDLNKDALYARLKVPELWRYNGSKLRIMRLEGGSYQEVETSPTFLDWIPKSLLYKFLEWCKTLGEVEAERRLRTWIKEKVNEQ